MRNIEELRKSLVNNYTQIKAGKMKPMVGKELNNAAGKIINSCKVEIEYNALMGVKKKIAFLETK